MTDSWLEKTRQAPSLAGMGLKSLTLVNLGREVDAFNTNSHKPVGHFETYYRRWRCLPAHRLLTARELHELASVLEKLNGSKG